MEGTGRAHCARGAAMHWVCNVQCTVRKIVGVQGAVHCALCTLHTSHYVLCTLHNSHGTLRALHYVPDILQCVHGLKMLFLPSPGDMSAYWLGGQWAGWMSKYIPATQLKGGVLLH